MNKIFIKAIRLYRKVSYFLRITCFPSLTYTTCKFYPSCSEYAEIAINKHGIIKGSIKSLNRVLRCRPLTEGGVDFP